MEPRDVIHWSAQSNTGKCTRIVWCCLIVVVNFAAMTNCGLELLIERFTTPIGTPFNILAGTAHRNSRRVYEAPCRRPDGARGIYIKVTTVVFDVPLLKRGNSKKTRFHGLRKGKTRK